MAKTVVVIDDDYDDYIFLKDAIEAFDPTFKCIYFDDSDSAMDTMQSVQTFQTDVVFIDINMPLQTGDQFLRVLRKSSAFKNVAIIMFSTFMPDDFARSLVKEGATLAFQKPNTMNEYMKVLQQIFKS